MGTDRAGLRLTPLEADIPSDRGSMDNASIPTDLSISTARLRLQWLSPTAIRGLLDGSVGDVGGATVTEAWLAAMAPRLRMRLEQIARDPRRAPFLLRAMIDCRSLRLVGHVGFHGPPGSNALGAADALELGYGVEVAARRKGYATEAAVGMIEWAEREHDIHRYLASVGPWNVASLGLVRKLGFSEVTRVLDEEDGEEIVFELRRERP